ncbi:MAG: hypothetical protein L0229_11035 [Blastocatellia bacterium]|nr:hypothetical protein [Blastocatellia bacterium]
MATVTDTDSQEAVEVKDKVALGVEYPVQLAHTSEPVLRLAGTISVIRSGKRDPALSDQEWRDLGLEDAPDAG